ncbi:MAG: HEAT repeat domain-containing protein [Roseofilum sp. SID2]|uniref:HEAT repeat domain-containing protein n=1 Tax=unclassified Roseofilum TaxID=2620099 RepID=UPI001B04A6D5|nr:MULTISPECIES: HEAT repeat domain-containing protein [unclassified Roseofilum]MBP0014014.1 HEAT repeat domain-containing protein [Roseofilum sp. SID3]MBP0023803.1 HEAT repeat domain-containing protein [Roseofilum sp. SID2]MBP0036625.1 HEAT repeat domain-containing protein [Roseofilum sp. SID1]
MDKRFSQLFNLSEDQAIALLEMPLDQLTDPSDRYVAACHLMRYPTERSIAALIKAIQNQEDDLYNRIARRKAVESLGRLKAEIAMPTLRECLTDSDIYTVENTVWAIGQIGTDDPQILEQISQLLRQPNQSYRVIIQVLTQLGYQPALEAIKPFIDSDDLCISSVAIAATCQLSGDFSSMDRVVDFLHSDNLNVRRACIQDLMDTYYYPALPRIVQCPVSIVFRLRGIKHLAQSGIAAQKFTFSEVEPYFDQVIRDHPDTLEFVHEYDQTPSIEFAINELYSTDFGRCYLASYTLLHTYPKEAPEALLATFAEKANNDYGAHYHVVKLLGWLGYSPAYDLLVEALHNEAPQFQKSRAAAAISLGNLGATEAIPLLHEALKTSIFDLKYASLLALDQLGDRKGGEICAQDQDLILQAKALTQASH